MLNQLRHKFVATMTLVATLLLFMFLSAIYCSVARNLETESLRTMESVNQLPIASPFSPDSEQSEPRMYYFILMKNPRGVLTIIRNSGFDLSDPDMLSNLYHTAASDPRGHGVIEKASLRYLRLTTATEERYIFADISEELSILSSLRKGYTALGLLSLLMLFGITNLLAKWMIAPVERSWAQQRQFVADASHELKTPLTVILTNTELLTSADCPTEDKGRLVEGIAAMSLRMRQLVEGMLELARVDSGVEKAAFETVNYSELVEQSLLPFEPAYFESGRVLESAIAPGILLRGSEPHLAQVTDILLDNAMKYSHEGSTVRLTLQKQGRCVLLCVDSPGTPLSPRQCEDIFRRFYIVDKARTGSSYGLGLSIAQAIVEEHSGKIWAESKDGHNRFYVKLPL